MAKVGRKPNDNSEYAIHCRQCIGQRLKIWRESRKLTQEALVDLLGDGFSVPTLQRYEGGKTVIPPKKAKKLEALTGVIKEFWTGETVAETKEFYETLYLEEIAEQEWNTQFNKSISEERQRFEQFFSVLGYSFEDTNRADAKDAGEAFDLGLFAVGPYEIYENNSDDVPPTLLSHKDLLDLISQIKDLVAFTCYKKNRQHHFPILKQNQKHFGGLKRPSENK